MAGPIAIAIIGDNSKLRRSLDDSNSRLGRLGGAVGKVGAIAATGLAAAGAGAAAFAVSAVKAASDAQQSVGATETVFGRFAKRVVADSDKAAQAYGLSANEYRENANLIGSLFKNQGVAADQLAGKTKGMIGTASDLAATFGGTTSDAVAALSSAFKGEFDPLERYGISIKQSTINAELAARGQDKLTGAALAQAKQVATTSLITKQAGGALGAFGRETDTLAHQQQVLGATWENLKAKAGTALLPPLTSLAKLVTGTVLPAVERFAPKVRTLAGELGDKLRPVLSGAVDLFKTVAPIVLDVARSVGTSLAPVARQLGKTFKAQVLPAVQQLMGAFKRWAPTILKVASIGLRLSAAILGRVLPVVIRLAGFLIRNVVRAFVVVGNTIVGAIRIVGRIAGALAAGARGFADFAGKVRARIGDALRVIGGIPGKVKDKLAGAGSWLLNAGKNAIGGFISGLRSMAGNIITAIRETITDKLPGFVKKALGIASPSKLFAFFGRMVPAGLVEGLRAGGPLVTKAVDQLQQRLRVSDSVTLPARLQLDTGSGRVDQLRQAGSVAAGGPLVIVNVDVAPTADRVAIGREIQAALDAWLSVGGRQAVLTNAARA